MGGLEVVTMRSRVVRPAAEAVRVIADQKIIDLQRKYGDGFYRLARSREICHLEALDIVQTSLLAMRERLITKGPVKNELAYLRRVVLNQIAQFFRDQEKSREEPFSDLEVLMLSATAESDEQSPIEMWPADKRRLLDAANMAVRELREPLREIYELADIGRIEPADIAEMLQINPGTVRASLCRAREQVRKRAYELLASPADYEEKWSL
jgi:RNA polymerase sigma factor (sigma-70 family)